MALMTVARPLSRRLVVASLMAGAVAQADTAEVIFAAENALYGAGYDIGRADGWLDEPLRAAIRKYQSDNRALDVTGELDPATLAALGASTRPESPVSSNTLASREAARSALDLPPASTETRGSPEPVALVSARQDVEVEPEAPEPTQAPSVVVASEPEPEAKPTVARQPMLDSEPEPSPEPAMEKPRTPKPVAGATAPVSPDPQEVNAGATAKAPVSAPPEPEPMIPVEPQSADPVETHTVAVVQGPSESDPRFAEPSPEPTQAVPTPASEPPVAERTTAPRSSGGFFSALFDFLFGWLV